MNALVFLYKQIIGQPLGDILGAVRAKRPQRLPVVLTRDEVRELFQHLDGPCRLPACLLYGSGLRLMECLRLRVKDLDFDHRAITVRSGNAVVSPLADILGSDNDFSADQPAKP